MQVLLLAALSLSPAVFAHKADKNLGRVGNVSIQDTVEVPLLLGPYGDELPYVEVKLKANDTKSYLFRVDLGEPGITLNCGLAKDLGLKKKNHNKNVWKSFGRKSDKAVYGPAGKQTTVSMDALHIGGLVLKDVTLACGSVDQNPLELNEELNPVAGVIGSGALGLAVAVLPSRGLVRFAPKANSEALLAELGGAPLEFAAVESRMVKTGFGKEYQPPQPGALKAQVAGKDLLLGISTGDLAGTVPMVDLGVAPSYRIGDLDVIRAGVRVGDKDLGEGWFVKAGLGSLPQPGIDGVVGYDVLKDWDIAVDTTTGRLAIARVTASKRTPSFPIAMAQVEAALADANKPPEDGKTLNTEEEESRNKKIAGALVKQSKYLLLAGRSADAVSSLQKAAEIEANDCATWKLLGQAHWYAGQADEARKATTRAWELYDAWAQLPLKERKKIEKEKPEDQKAAGHHPQDLDACHDAAGQLALIELGQGKDAAAIDLFRKHLDLDPSLPLAAGVAMLRDGKVWEAQGPLRQTLKLAAPQAESGIVYQFAARLALARAYDLAGDAESAATNWEASAWALAYDPLALDMYQGILAKARGDEAALDSLGKLAARFPDSPMLILAHAQALDKAGKASDAAPLRARALEALRAQAELRPTLASGWGLLAWGQVQVGDKEAARVSAEKAIALLPSEPYALLTLARIEGEQNPEKARQYVEKARGFGALNLGFALLSDK